MSGVRVLDAITKVFDLLLMDLSDSFFRTKDIIINGSVVLHFQQLTVEHEIAQIQIVCQDERDLNCFAYISQDGNRHFCHVFCVLTAVSCHILSV